MTTLEILHWHGFCGSGSGAHGFNRGEARVGQARAAFRCLGGVDVDPGAVRDFSRLTGTPGTCLDLFDRDQYVEWHGHEPPEGWREVRPDDIRKSAQGERPHIVFLSAPCKGFSGLLNSASSKSRKYQALNRLTVRGVHLMLEAWADDPPELVVFENVPRIATRGRPLIDLITELLRAYGYAVAETTHDCGELGGLAQHRRRFLLVARHREKVPPFLYEPPKRRVRGVGEVIGSLPLPDSPEAGPMHRLPRLQWRTWERLALVPAGGDWRDLHRLDWERLAIVPGGRLRDPRPPRPLGSYQPYGVIRWTDTSHTVTSQAEAGSGAYSVGDPRMACDVNDRQGRRHNNVYRVIRWDETAQAVTTGGGPSSGGQSVADPRPGRPYFNDSLGVTPWARSAPTVTANGTPGSGRFSVSDPRVGSLDADRPGFRTQGHYGVLGWDDHARAVTGSACHDNGANSVADPRPLPGPREVLDPPPIIIALDDTWHRPLTTLELAALQTFPVELLMAEPLDGKSHSGWRQHIGNAVPADAAQAIASECGRTLLLAWSGSTFQLRAEPIWVDRFRWGAALAGSL